MTNLDILSRGSRQPLPSIIPASWSSPFCLFSALLNVGPLSDSLPTNRIWQKFWDDTSETELQTDCGFCVHHSREHPSHSPLSFCFSDSFSDYQMLCAKKTQAVCGEAPVMRKHVSELMWKGIF